MDPEFGDDLIAGFSSEEEGEDDDGNLDLLASMLERDDTSENTRTKSSGKKRKSSVGGRERKERRMDGDCKEKVVSSKDEMETMKAQMLQMQEELSRLRKKVTEDKKQPQPRTAPRSSGGGKRVAHQQHSAVSATISKLSDGAHRMKTGHPTATSSSSSVPVAMVTIGDREVAAGIISQRRVDKDNDCDTENYSGIRIKNPLVSSELMRQRMKGRKMVRIPKISNKMRDGDVEGDWVTMGVVVDKLPPRDSAKGNKFTVWKISDLSGQSAVVSLFLFGKAYEEHWKTSLGYVVALLNPSIMPDKESPPGGKSYTNNVALSVDHPQKLMLMGTSQDFTICKAHTKSGKKCTNFAKMSDGGFCDYHTQGAYSKMRSKRMEFQSGYGPSSTSTKLREKLFQQSKTDVFYYGGQSFTSSSSRESGSSSGKSPPEMERRLFVPGAKVRAAEISKELKERREVNAASVVQSGRGVVTQEGSETFKRMLKTQSAGARMLSKHLQKEEVATTEEKLPEKSALELLKEHKKELSVKTKVTKKLPHQKSSKRKKESDAEFENLFAPDCVLSVDGQMESLPRKTCDKDGQMESLPRKSSQTCDEDGQMESLPRKTCDKDGQMESLPRKSSQTCDEDGQMESLPRKTCDKDAQMESLPRKSSQTCNEDGQMESLPRKSSQTCDEDGQMESLPRKTCDKDGQMESLPRKSSQTCDEDGQMESLPRKTCDKDGQMESLPRKSSQTCDEDCQMESLPRKSSQTCDKDGQMESLPRKSSQTCDKDDQSDDNNSESVPEGVEGENVTCDDESPSQKHFSDKIVSGVGQKRPRKDKKKNEISQQCKQMKHDVTKEGCQSDVATGSLDRPTSMTSPPLHKEHPRELVPKRQPCLRMMEQQQRGGASGASSTPFSPPQLGRGLRPGSLVDFNSPNNRQKAASAKLKALAIVRHRGPIEDPNTAVKKKSLTAAQLEAIRKRVQESCHHSDSDSGEGTDTNRPAKRPKLDPENVERILNAKSSHEWAVREEEWEREQEYFEHLEKKENMEEKMKNLREIRVTVVQCKQCNYIAEHPGELCKKENHHLSRHKAVKRWFECQQCRERCCTYNTRYPTDTCRKCGDKSFKRTCLFKERQGPKLPSEQLLVRGVEEKYLNSLK